MACEAWRNWTKAAIKIVKALRIRIAILLWIGALGPLFAQEGPLKSYAEDNRERKFCFYPSTLRMINIQGDTLINDVISDIRKLLVYKLTSERLDKELRDVFTTYEEKGFEEYARVYGAGNDIILMGKERFGQDEYVGVAGSDGQYFAFYMRGDIRWDKVPTVIERIRDNPILDTLVPLNDEVVREQEHVD